jgi:hypothetical protein
MIQDARSHEIKATSLSISSWTMHSTRPREMPSCSAIDLAEMRWSSKISSWIWSMISGVVGLRTYQHPVNCIVSNKTGDVRVNAKLRSVRVTIFALNKQHYVFWVFVYSFSYSAWKLRVPHFHLWPVRLYHIFPVSHKNHDVRNKIIEHEKCVLIFCTKSTWIISYSENNWARHFHKFGTSSCNVSVILARL